MVNLTNLNEDPSQRNRKSLANKYNIPISNLDFDYIRKCSNGDELEKILLILRSGEEGHYPALIKETEDLLEIIRPNSKYNTKTTPVVSKQHLEENEKLSLKKDIQKWLETASKNEEEFINVNQTATNNNLPQIRANKLFTELTTKSPVQRIKSTDYSAWDQYDPDTEILRMDLEMEQLKKELEEQKKIVESAPIEENSNPFLTQAEEIFEADREREKGNEYFKAGDYKQALQCYTNSIYFAPSAANYNNRALTEIRLGKYEEAIKDCKTALRYEPQNIKALNRLAQCYDVLKNYEKALQVSKVAIKINPNSEFIQNLIKKLNDHFGNNQKKTRLKIKEINESKEPNNGYNINNFYLKNNKTKKKNKPTLIPIPGPSCMPEPYFIKINSKNPALIKRQELMIKNRPQLLHMGVVDDSDEYDCTEIHLHKSDSKFNISNENDVYFDNTSKNFKNKCIQKTTLSIQEYEDVDSVMDNLMNIDISENNYECKNNLKNEKESLKINRDNCSQKTTLSTQEYNQEVKKKLMNVDITENNIEKHVNIIGPERNASRILDQRGEGEPHIDKIFSINHRDATTPYSFLKLWRCVEKDSTYRKQAEVLKNLNIENLNTVIGYKLDGSMLVSIIFTLYLHFSVPNEIEFVYSILEALTRVSRFTIAVMFLTEDDKRRIKCLFQFLNHHGKTVNDNIKNMYL